MRELAERYVRLVLGIGHHDADYVDAYYGPVDWRPVAPPSLDQLRGEATDLLDGLMACTEPEDELSRLRLDYLRCQVRSTRARLRMLAGERLSFDEESKALYDAVAPTYDEGYFEQAIAGLERRLPGSGPLVARLEAFRAAFVIPLDRLDRVFTAAIEACRARTLTHLPMPPGERFSVEYVTGRPWSGYNWFKGSATSLIQVNTELVIYIDRAIDLAAHEGYPGHHVYNALLEWRLVRERDWPEYSVYALFSPQSLIAEGTANFGIDVVLPGAERLEFEREQLFPLAGLDPSRAEEYYDVAALLDRLSYAGNEAARRYLDGAIDRAEAVAWLERYALMPAARAEQRTRFFDTYRSYVINYNFGKDLVRQFIEARGGTADRPDVRWSEFARLLSSPRLPSGLQVR
jgi:hypothetical protein